MCDEYAAWKRGAMVQNFEEHWAGLLFTSVPGGATVNLPGGKRGAGLTAKQDRKQFEAGMYGFEDRLKSGVEPEGTTVAALNRQEKRAESFARAEKKYKSGELDARGIHLTPKTVATMEKGY
jgi:hypothetical protein